MRCNVTLRQIASSPPLKLALLEDISLNEKQKNREISAKYQTLVDSKNVSDTMLVPPSPWVLWQGEYNFAYSLQYELNSRVILFLQIYLIRSCHVNLVPTSNVN